MSEVSIGGIINEKHNAIEQSEVGSAFRLQDELRSLRNCRPSCCSADIWWWWCTTMRPRLRRSSA